MIQLKNLTKRFDDNLVLDNIDLEIQQGQIVGLLGPNGAGKTTTMRIITGFLSPTSGKNLIDGEDIHNPKVAYKLKKDIGYLPENNPLYYEMLVHEYLQMICELKQMKKDKITEEIKKAVKKAGIESVYYRPIADLSKGYKQRVGLAASILGDPKILILDEPTEGLDPNQRIDIRNLIKNLGQDKTVIISSHVLSEVENTCDRIIIINKGKIVADGSTREIIAGAKGKKQLHLEIEGNLVEEKIKKLAGEENIKTKKQENNKLGMIIEIDTDVELRPEIFKIAKDSGWVIWEMYQKEMSLEDVFRELTK